MKKFIAVLFILLIVVVFPLAVVDREESKNNIIAPASAAVQQYDSNQFVVAYRNPSTNYIHLYTVNTNSNNQALYGQIYMYKNTGTDLVAETDKNIKNPNVGSSYVDPEIHLVGGRIFVTIIGTDGRGLYTEFDGMDFSPWRDTTFKR